MAMIWQRVDCSVWINVWFAVWIDA